MKKIISILFLLISINVSGQTHQDSLGLKLFDRGLDFYNQNNLDSAVAIWTEIVDKKIGLHYDVYGNAFFNIPTIYWQMGKYDKAKEWYKKVLASDLRDNDETGSLMEPHTNYKHKSAFSLAKLYSIDSNYLEVLNWLFKADTLYPYWGFEGSATNVSQEEAYLLNWKTNTLLRLNRKEEAIQSIITELICSSTLEEFFQKSEDTLLTLFEKKSFKSDFDNAINSLVVQTIDTNKSVAIFILHGLEYKIPISNIYPDRNIPHYRKTLYVNHKQTIDNNYLVNYIRDRNFYKRLDN